MACTTGCPTQDHQSYGECLRAKNSRVAYCNSAAGRDYTAQKKWDTELAFYRKAKAEGIQPAGTKTDSIERAFRISDKLGKAYVAG